MLVREFVRIVYLAAIRFMDMVALVTSAPLILIPRLLPIYAPHVPYTVLQI